ncbi:flagellin [Bradyrhizobium sp. USDA 4472]
MSGIVLSASVRQNLLSLQSTADLLATTQSRLSTGKKVNSALDNPTNFFTAQSLDNRASDINNLLDGIANGVQVLQAANTGITSLSKLLDSAKSIANQALQTTVGYSSKSNVSTTIAGATAADLRGTTTYSSATALSNVLFSGTAGGTTAAAGSTTLGGTIGATTGSQVKDNQTTATAITTGTLLYGTGGGTPANAGLSLIGATQFTDGTSFTVNGHSITFKSGDLPSVTGSTNTLPAGYGQTGNIATDGNGNSIVYLGSGASNSTATVGDVLNAIDLASGVQNAVVNTTAGTAALSTPTGNTASSITGGKITLETSTGGDLNVVGKADLLGALGLTSATGSGNATVTATRTTASGSLGSLISDGSTLNVNGKTITFKNAVVPAAANVPTGSSIAGTGSNVVTDGNGNSTVYLQAGKVSDVLTAIDLATGVQTIKSTTSGTATLQTTAGATNSSIVAGALHISTGANSDLSITGSGNALSSLGLTGSTGTGTAFTASRAAAPGSISGKTLTFASFNGGTAVNVTFGDGTGGTVKTLDQLNTQLQANNLTATIDANGLLTVSVTNDYASSTIGSAVAGGAIGGTITTALTWTNATTPTVDPVAQATRSNLVAQYNNIMSQIDTTSVDSSFNGVNLLNGDQLKLVFDETGKSSLNITGVTFNSKGLGLAGLVQGTDFIDNSATNKVLTSLNAASSTLRSEASTLGSNLSVVQVRQDFNKNLINVLQTGSSNLTLADTNEEAANSQALSTRQSIAVSALSLANTSQQSVLQLLR